MRIGIDARFYGPNIGIGRYLQELITNLEKIDQQNEYVIFLRRDNFDLYQSQNLNFKKALTDIPWYGIKEQIFLPFKFLKYRLDILHFPNYNVPLLCLIPKITAKKGIILTIHDLISYQKNASASTLHPLIFKIKRFLFLLLINRAIKLSKKIFTVSKHSKQEIMKFHKINPEKIIVTYEAANNIIMNNESSILLKLKISQPYLLYVGNAYPHKNLEKLVDAFDIISKEENIKLVLVGKIDYFYNRLKKIIIDRGLEEKIILTDVINDGDLNCLYRNALLYTFPSLMEGFGLPGLEAMKRGLPVICSNIEVFSEIYGEAAQYFEPLNVSDMAKVILDLIKNPALRDNLVNKGLEQVKKFSWEKCARETLDVYQSLE